LPFDGNAPPSVRGDNETSPADNPPGYLFAWRIAAEVLTATVTVDRVDLGWIGFGIAELTSGGMVGADVVQMRFGSFGQPPEIQDGYTVAHTAPIRDAQQDWVLVSGSEGDGKTTFTVSRKLVTNDGDDRPLLYGMPEVKMIFALNRAAGAGFHQ
jgi:hypothetical protein